METQNWIHIWNKIKLIAIFNSFWRYIKRLKISRFNQKSIKSTYFLSLSSFFMLAHTTVISFIYFGIHYYSTLTFLTLILTQHYWPNLKPTSISTPLASGSTFSLSRIGKNSLLICEEREVHEDKITLVQKTIWLSQDSNRRPPSHHESALSIRPRQPPSLSSFVEYNQPCLMKFNVKRDCFNRYLRDKMIGWHGNELTVQLKLDNSIWYFD